MFAKNFNILNTNICFHIIVVITAQPPIIFFNIFNFVQVSPELYGDNYPRFFTYWTVSNKISFNREKNCNIFLMLCNNNTVLINLSIYRLMFIKQLGVTIYYAPALFRLTIELQLGLQSLPFPHTIVDNSILAYWFGR